MKPINRVETIAIPMCKPFGLNSFKKEITYKIFTYKLCMHIFFDVYKQMTYVKLLLLHGNTWNHLTVPKKWAQARLKVLSTKCVYKSYNIIYKH